MFCAECGSNILDDTQFCGECGNAVGSAEANPPPAHEAVARVVELGGTPNAVPNGLKFGVVVATIFFPFVGVIMGLIFIFKDARDDHKVVGRLWLYTGLAMFVVWTAIGGSSF